MRYGSVAVEHDWHGMVSTCKVCCIPCINSWWFVRVILWRFVEITCRVFLLVLIWINLGGATLMIILTLETLLCLVFAYSFKSYVLFLSLCFSPFGFVRSSNGYMHSVDPLCLIICISMTMPREARYTVYDTLHHLFVDHARVCRLVEQVREQPEVHAVLLLDHLGPRFDDREPRTVMCV